jgi:hypothetical protein
VRVVVVAAVLALATAGTFRVVDPTLLDPWRLGVPIDRAMLDAHRRAARLHPESSLRHRRLGNLLYFAGDAVGAVRELELAVKALPAVSHKRASAVQRAVVLHDLARASAGAGAEQQRAAAMAEHLRIVTELRDGVRDPHVRGEFDRVLRERSSAGVEGAADSLPD